MKRQAIGTESLVYAYRCAAPLAGMEHIEAERERMRQFWNRLVDIDREAERAFETAAAADIAELAVLYAEVQAITLRIRAAATKTNARKLVVERRGIERQTWPLLAAWRKSHADGCRAIESRRRARVIEARQERSVRSADDGASVLYWSNSNNVLDDYETARKTVRQFGRRLRRIEAEDDGRGCLTVQIQRTRSGLGAASSELQDGTFTHVQIGAVDPRAHDPLTFRGERRRLVRTTLEIRVDAAGNMARLPLVLHRALPADVRVKSAQVTWRTVPGGDTIWRVCFTLSRPVTRRAAEGSGTVRLKLGWETQRGALVVATGPSSLELPREWMAGIDRTAYLQGAIDVAFEALGPRDERSPLDLYEAIRAQHRIGRSSSADIEHWYRLHDTSYREMIGLRARLLGQRRERYRLWALGLARNYARLEIEAPASLAAHAQAERGEEANSLRHRAALSDLQHWIKHMAHKHGAAVEIVSAPVVSAIDVSKIRHISRAQRDRIMSAREDGAEGALAGPAA